MNNKLKSIIISKIENKEYLNALDLFKLLNVFHHFINKNDILTYCTYNQSENAFNSFLFDKKNPQTVSLTTHNIGIFEKKSSSLNIEYKHLANFLVKTTDAIKIFNESQCHNESFTHTFDIKQDANKAILNEYKNYTLLDTFFRELYKEFVFSSTEEYSLWLEKELNSLNEQQKLTNNLSRLNDDIRKVAVSKITSLNLAILK
jgi:hypothetical protein